MANLLRERVEQVVYNSTHAGLTTLAISTKFPPKTQEESFQFCLFVDANSSVHIQIASLTDLVSSMNRIFRFVVKPGDPISSGVAMALGLIGLIRKFLPISEL